MNQKLIHKEETRCDNHRCKKRMKCCRYLQLEIDKKDTTASVSVSKFNQNNCEKYLEYDDNN